MKELRKTNLNEILNYIVINYPIENDLTLERITNILFLCDWVSLVKNGESISNFQWNYDYDSLSSENILIEIKSDLYLQYQISEESIYFTQKIITSNWNSNFSIDEEIKSVLNKVIDISSKMYDNDLAKFTKNSYPLKNIESFSRVSFSPLKYKINKRIKSLIKI